ncbi:50S ribosomal protein L28 [Candidatus Saganbacteria bacterium]|nr:50S ribosomal protein L28 [Candidatus Saganbacteria bacterium]
MSRRCVICGKQPQTGNLVSHSNRKTKTRFYPNLQRVRMILKGKRVRDYVCTGCLKAGKVQKAL